MSVGICQKVKQTHAPSSSLEPPRLHGFSVISDGVWILVLAKTKQINGALCKWGPNVQTAFVRIAFLELC